MRVRMIDTFWQHFEIESDGCWIWQGAKLPNGYGSVFVPGEGGGGRQVGTHRVAFEKANGSIPAGAFVCHTCDRRACGNPEHLFLGDAEANYDDARKKKRHTAGERCHLHKLTAIEIRLIKRRLAKGDHNFSAIAADFGVHRCTINDIQAGRTWKEIEV